MSIRKRLWFVFALALVVFAMVVGSLTVALASLNANVNSGFTVSYTAKNVNASVAGSYDFSGTEKNMTIGGEEGLLTFQGAQSDGGGILTL